VATEPRHAEAHAILVRSDPAVNAELAISPDQVITFYSEALDERLSGMRVVDGRGDGVDNGEVTFGPAAEEMSVGLEGELEPGFYTVIWKTLSSVDGHLFEGSFPFTVLNPDGSQPSGPRFEASVGGSVSSQPQNVFVKWTQLLASAALLGALAFVLFINRPATSGLAQGVRDESRSATRKHLWMLAWPAVAVLALTAGAELVLQADQLGGFGYVGDVLKNDWGQRWIQRQAVLAGIIVVLLVGLVGERRQRFGLTTACLSVALAGMVIYQLLVALVSHGNAVAGSFWAVGADFLHLVSSSVWVGTLAMLVLFLLAVRRAAESDRTSLLVGHITRFSTIAATSVIVLLATGVLNSLAQIPSVDALVDTAYGRALLIKLAVMAFLLAVAGANAFFLRPRLLDDIEDGLPTEDTQRRLSTSVKVEVGLAVAVLLAASILVLQPTPRYTEAVQPEATSGQAVIGFEEVQPAGNILVNLTVSPSTEGQNSFRVFLFPTAGGDIGEVLRVRLRFLSPDEGVGASEVEMEPAGVNAYRAVGPFLSSPGDWTINVDVRRAEIDDVSASFPVPVESADFTTWGQFDFPLATGTWLTIAAVVLVVLALIAAAWIAEWPGLAEWSPRILRIGTASVVVIGVGMLVLSLLPGDEAEGTGNPIASSPESIAIGRSLYTQNCAVCHGDDGRGDGPQAAQLPVMPADFRQHVPYHQDEFFFLVISNGLGEIMPSFSGQLTEDERWHLVNFLKSEFGADDAQTANR
jgi:copper transport protein